MPKVLHIPHRFARHIATLPLSHRDSISSRSRTQTAVNALISYAPRSPEHARAPQSVPERSSPGAPQNALERHRTPQIVTERQRAPQHPPRAPQTAPKRPSSWPHHGAQFDPLATKELRNAPRPLTSSCLSANNCVSFIRSLA